MSDFPVALYEGVVREVRTRPPLELELELIQAHMVQKPMLQGEEVKKGRVARATDKAAIELVGVGGVSGYEITSKAIRVMNSGRCSLLIEWLFNFSFTSQKVSILLSCCFREPPKYPLN